MSNINTSNELNLNDILNLCYKVNDKFENKYNAGSRIKNAKVILLGDCYAQRTLIHNELIGLPVLPKDKNKINVIKTQHIDNNTKKKYIELDSDIKGTFGVKQLSNLSSILNKNKSDCINLSVYGVKKHCICYVNIAETVNELSTILQDYNCNYSSLFVVIVNHDKGALKLDLLNNVKQTVPHTNIIVLFVGIEDIEDTSEIQQYLNKNNDTEPIRYFCVKSNKCLESIASFNENVKYTGLVNMENHIINIFIQKYSKALPDIIQNIKQYAIELDKQKMEIGIEIPKDQPSQMSLINSLINNVSHEFITSIHNVNIQYNYGYTIQEIFVNLKNELSKLNFDDNLNSDYITGVKELCATNNLYSNMTTLKLVDYAVNDKKLNVFESIKSVCISHIDKVCQIIENMIYDILANNEISRYPNLISIISQKVSNDLAKYKENILVKISEYIICEQGFTWSTDDTFLNKCAVVDDTNENILANINIYLNHIKTTMALFVPKLIMQCIIRKAEKNVFSDLSTSIIYSNENVLQQDDNIQDKRQSICDVLLAVNKIIQVFELLSKM